MPGPAVSGAGAISQYLGTADCFVFTPSDNHNYSAAASQPQIDVSIGANTQHGVPRLH